MSSQNPNFTRINALLAQARRTTFPAEAVVFNAKARELLIRLSTGATAPAPDFSLSEGTPTSSPWITQPHTAVSGALLDCYA